MNIPSQSLRLSLCALLLCSISGCVIDAGGGSGSGTHQPSPGTLSVFSSIEGSTHPSQCDYAGAVDLEVAVYEGSSLYTIATAPCYDFQLVVTLPDSDYNADVTLLDGHSLAVSTTLRLDALRVIAGTDLQVDIDFPTSSLLP